MLLEYIYLSIFNLDFYFNVNLQIKQNLQMV